MTAFLGGFAQFFIPTHLLAVVALGLLARQPARHPAWAPALFAAGLVGGSLVVASAVRETPAAMALLMLATAAATLVIIARTSRWCSGALALATGVALPINAPPHEITIPAAVTAQIGFAVAAVATFALVVFVAMHATRPWQRIGVRILGSWIAASAILILALRLAR